MDVLLLNPNTRKKDSVEELPLLTPPINLMYVAQSMIDRGYKAEITDGLALDLSEKDLLMEIKKKKPEYIGIPLYSSDLTNMHILTRKIKELHGFDGSIKIFFAGHHASTLSQETMEQFPDTDYLVRGEGEFTTLNLLDSIEKRGTPAGVKGISYREGRKIIHEPEERPIEDIDTVPIPSRKLIDTSLYYSRMSKRAKVDILITSRGCPYKCTFCAKLNETFRSYRERSISNVLEELQTISESGTDGIEIYDEIFTLKRKRAMDLLAAIRKEKMDFEFRIRTRVTHVDKELLASLKKTGCSTISYGVESGSQEILNKITKEITPRKVVDAFLQTEKSGMNVLGFFMIGNRGETRESIGQTVDFAKKLNPLFATFGVLHPYPGTLDYIEAKQKGTLQGDYAPYKPLPWIKLPWTKTIDDLYSISSKAYEEYYKRPVYIKKYLSSVLRDRNWNLAGYTARNFYKRLSRINAI